MKQKKELLLAKICNSFTWGNCNPPFEIQPPSPLSPFLEYSSTLLYIFVELSTRISNKPKMFK